MKTLRYIGVRVVMLGPVLLGISLLTFAVAHLVPGDPARMLAGDQADRATLEAIRTSFRLDDPLWVQYLVYLQRLLQGDMGTSYREQVPVLEALLRTFPATLELAIVAVILALAAALPLGILGAVYHNRVVDHVIRVLSVGGVSIPVFWLGIMLLLLFYYRLGWLPGTGRLDPHLSIPPQVTGMYLLDSLLAGQWATFRDALLHILLPAFSLAYGYLALVARMLRSSMLDVLGQDYIRTARAMGLPFDRIVVGHALKNAMIPTVTVAGLGIATLLGGAVLTETVYSWPGMGKLMVDSILFLDYPVVTGATMLIAATYVTINLFVDVLYTALNPQIE
ncbi:MAG: ABC transporter permease [Chloroflexi bacterium]|nr:ABC transporter permease [Chloroflexota bacterium]